MGARRGKRARSRYGVHDQDDVRTHQRDVVNQDALRRGSARREAEVERERKRLERELGRKPTTNKLTTNEIRALVGRLREIVSVLAEASPQDKRAIYDELGVNLTYDPASKTVRAGAGDPGVLRVGVGGGT